MGRWLCLMRNSALRISECLFALAAALANANQSFALAKAFHKASTGPLQGAYRASTGPLQGLYRASTGPLHS